MWPAFKANANHHGVSVPTQLHYLRLPKDISEDHVILMDCTVSTGAAAMMAVRVLLVSKQHYSFVVSAVSPAWPFNCVCACVAPLQDHDVQEDKILMVSLLMAEMGVHSVAYAFPQVKIITTAVDKKVNDLFHIIPGIGESRRRAPGDAKVRVSSRWVSKWPCLSCRRRQLRGPILWNGRSARLERRRDGRAQLLIDFSVCF